jgi:Fe2+ or Zn2+ uptake regulation protein
MGVDVPVGPVHQALELLVRRGLVERTVVAGGPAIYRAPRGRAAPAVQTNGG